MRPRSANRLFTTIPAGPLTEEDPFHRLAKVDPADRDPERSGDSIDVDAAAVVIADGASGQQAARAHREHDPQVPS